MDTNYKYFEAVNLAMQNNDPHSRWIKVQLARVLLRVIDPLTGLPSEIIIEGNASLEQEKELCVYNCWSPLETAYLERNNQYHILNGNIIRYGDKIVLPQSINAVSDEEILDVLNKKFLALDNLLKKLTSPIPVERILSKAIEIDKPIATITAIKARLAELQENEYKNNV